MKPMKIQRVNVRIKKLHKDAVIPKYAKVGDAGFDLYATEDVIIEPGEPVIIPTGLAFGLPEGYEIQVRPRSGVSSKSKLRVANSPGTVDYGYRGEVGVIVDNISNMVYEYEEEDDWSYARIITETSSWVDTLDGEQELEDYQYPVGTIKIRKGDRIAQGVLAEVPMARFEEVDELDETERGADGFGSSGVQ